MFLARLLRLIQIRVDFTKSWLFCMAPTWTGICLAVILRDGWLHGPPTCVKGGWTFLRSFCYRGCTVLGNRARVASGMRSGAFVGTTQFMILGVCVSLRCGCLTSSCWKEPCSRCCRVRRHIEKGIRGNLTILPSSITSLSCICIRTRGGIYGQIYPSA